MRRRFIKLIALTPILLCLKPAFSHESKPHSPREPAQREQQTWGIAGDAHAVKRTVLLRMDDTMRFSPSHLAVRQGETLRLRIQNAGQLMHELVIGTAEALQTHAELMKRFPNMEHDEPHMAHVAAGQRGELIWTFNRPGEFHFACLIAGHFDAGMRGTITVAAR